MNEGQSYLHWVANSLGVYSLLIPIAGLLAFVLTILMVTRGKGTAGALSLLFIVPLPLFVGIYAGIEGAISAYSVIAISDAVPKPSLLAAAISTSLIAPLVGMMFMAPSYVVAMFGLFTRGLSSDDATRSSYPK